jgi:hypothetical protein
VHGGPFGRCESTGFHLRGVQSCRRIAHCLAPFDPLALTALPPETQDLKQRQLYVPHGMAIPPEIAALCAANVDTSGVESHRNALVHTAAPGPDLRRGCMTRQVTANDVSGRPTSSTPRSGENCGECSNDVRLAPRTIAGSTYRHVLHQE